MTEGRSAAGPSGSPTPARTLHLAASTLARTSLLFFLASLVMGVGVLLWNATHAYTDWPSTSDDMFYYLVLARETAAHGVVSADGLRPTNGFHPLWFLVLLATQPLVSSSALPGVALAFLGLLHAGTSVLLWRTLRRIAGPGLAAVIAGLYAGNPFVLRVVFAGVETALAAILVGLCLWGHLRWLEHGRAADRWLSLGALGLAVAARTDTAMLAAALAGSAAVGRLRETRDPRAALRAIDWAPVAVAVMPVLAFGAWSQVATGEILQTSGRALSFWQSVGDWRLIREAVSPRVGVLATPVTALVYALEVILQFVGWITRAPIELFGAHPIGVMVVAGALVARLRLGPSGTGPSAERVGNGRGGAGSTVDASVRRRLRRDLIIFFLLLWTFYALLFRHCQIWYWHTSVYAAALLVALWLEPLNRLARATAEMFPSPRVLRGTVVVVMISAVALTAHALDDLRPRHPGAAAPRAASAADPLAQVPAGATLGAFDTGRLGWEQSRLRVVNLDGLVNNAAYRALRGRRIGRYMLDERVEWLYVRDRVVDRFRAFGLRDWLEEAEPVGRSGDGVVLYRLRGAAVTP